MNVGNALNQRDCGLFWLHGLGEWLKFTRAVTPLGLPRDTPGTHDVRVMAHLGAPPVAVRKAHTHLYCIIVLFSSEHSVRFPLLSLSIRK